jgi:hypothetical protein
VCFFTLDSAHPMLSHTVVVDQGSSEHPTPFYEACLSSWLATLQRQGLLPAEALPASFCGGPCGLIAPAIAALALQGYFSSPRPEPPIEAALLPLVEGNMAWLAEWRASYLALHPGEFPTPESRRAWLVGMCTEFEVAALVRQRAPGACFLRVVQLGSRALVHPQLGSFQISPQELAQLRASPGGAAIDEYLLEEGPFGEATPLFMQAGAALLSLQEWAASCSTEALQAVVVNGGGHFFTATLHSAAWRVLDSSADFNPFVLHSLMRELEAAGSVGAGAGAAEGGVLLLEDTQAGGGAAPTPPPSQALQVNGPSLPLEDLGPIIVNADGTTSRILGWAEKSAEEQDTTMRLIAKRNAKRLALLRAQGEEGKE